MSFEYLSIPKVRKKIQDFNRMIKQVYTEYRCVNGLIIPLVMDNIKSRPLFDKSFFTSKDEDFIKCPFINECAVDSDNFNKAMQPKVKCFTFKEKDESNYLTNDNGDEILIGMKLKESDIKDSFNYMALDSFHKLKELDPVDMYTLSEYDKKAISEYDILDKIIGRYGNMDVNLIMAKELFPLVKKADTITVFSYKDTSLPDNIFTISIISVTDVCVFTSIHSIVTM